MRIRGSIFVPKSTPQNTTYAFGIAMVSEEAGAAGSVPNPASGSGADWDGWMFYRANVLDPVDAGGTIFDCKAMRKFQGGQALVFVAGVDTISGGGAASMAIELVARGLFLLP